MSKLAETLYAARRLRGERLEDVEQAIRIRVAHLQALETDDFRRLPPPVYTRGFVRNYAAHLGLDPEQTVRLYDEAIGYRPEPVRISPSGSVRISRLVAPNVAAIGMGVALAAILFVWLYSAVFIEGPGRASRLPTPTVPTPTPLTAFVVPTATSTSAPATPTPAAPTAPPATRPAGTPAPSQPAPPPPTATPQPTPVQGLVLTATIVGAPSWLQVRTDGVVVFTGTLAPGAERTFTASNEIFIHSGRSDAVELTLNGAPLGRLGQAGQTVVRRTFSLKDVATPKPAGRRLAPGDLRLTGARSA